MKKTFLFAFLAMLLSFTLLACRKEEPTVEISLDSTVNTISYNLSFSGIDTDDNRKYKIVLTKDSSVVIEDINLLTEVKGEFKNLQYNTVYSVTVFVGEKAKSTDYNVEIGKESISTKLNEFKNISFEDKNVTYNGEEHSIYVKGAPEGTKIEYVDNNGKKYVDKYVQTDVGTYEVTAKLTKDGYKEATLKAKLVISKRNHSFNFKDFSKEYDGQPIDVSLNTSLDVKYEYYSGNNKLNSAPINVGEYTVKAIFAGDKNNSKFELTAKYIILEADVKLVLNNKTVSYTGLPQELEADTDVFVTYEYYSGNTKLDSAPVDAGKYIVKAIYAGDDNHEAKTAEAILTIEKAKTAISVSKKEITVDYGKTISLNASVSNGATPTIKYNTTDGKAPVNVGEYTATISYAGDDNHEKAEDVVVKIIIQSADVELKLDNETITYDGNAHELSIDTPLDIIYEYYLNGNKLSGAPVNAGVYTVKAIFAGDENHEAKTVEATLTIKKVTTKLTVNNVEVTYDGNAHTVEATLSNNATPTIDYNTTDGKAPINAGEYTATVSYAGDDNHEAVETQTVIIVIKKVVVTLEVSTNNNVIYDGNSHGVTATLSNGEVPTIEYNTLDKKAPVNAGEYTATITYAGDENHQAIQTKRVNFTINKATYDMSGIKFENKTVEYDGQLHEITITGTLPEGVSVEYTNNSGSEVNKYKAIAEFIYDVENYNTITNKIAYLVITKATFDISGIKFENLTVPYDGEEHELLITGDLPYGATVKYINNKGIGAGYYEASAVITLDDPNFNEIPVLRATLTINKAKVELPEATPSFVYDGTAKVAVNAHDLYTVEGATQTNAGSYEAVVTLKDTANYEWAETFNGKVAWAIEKAMPVITVENKYITVDLGNDYEINYSISNNLTATLTYNTVDGKKPTEAGTYTATISYEGSTNYSAVSVSVIIKINNPDYKNINVEVYDVEIVYGQTYKVNYKVTDSEGNVIDDYTEEQVRISVSNSTKLPVDAGEYEVLVEVSSREDLRFNAGSGIGTIVINKADIDVSEVVFENDEFAYDGNEHNLTASNLPEGISDGYKYWINNEIAPNKIDAGTYKVELIFTNDKEDAYNYNPIDSIYATMVIKKVDTELIIPKKSYDLLYGESFPTLASLENGDLDNLEIKYYNSNDEEVELPSAVGEYYAIIKYNGNKNYNPIEKGEIVSINISALQYDFGFVGPFTKVYDGKPFIVKVNQEIEVIYKYYVTDNNFENRQLISGYPVDAGSYIVVASVEGGNGFAPYSVEERLQILVNVPTLTVKFNGETVSSDQNVSIDYLEEYIVTATVSNNDNDNIEITYSEASGEVPTLVATYTVMVHYVSNNYGEIRFFFYLTINQIEPKVEFEKVQTIKYDGLEHEAQYEKVYEDCNLNKIMYRVGDGEWTLELPKEVGTYEFMLVFGHESGNYKYKEFFGTLIITPTEMVNKFKLEDKTTIYTGESQGLEVEGDIEGLTVVYSYELNGESVSKPKNVGTYNVTATISDNDQNTEDIVLTATLTITEADFDRTDNPKQIEIPYVPGMTVADILDKLTEKSLTPKDQTVVLSSGTNMISVSYKAANYKPYEYEFKVICKPQITGYSLVFNGQQIKGRNFDSAALVLYELLNDGTKNTVTKDVTINTTNPDTTDSFEASVTYKDETYTCDITPIDAPELMIYAVYGAGGNSGATYKTDFVILYNASANDIDLTNYTLWQYSSTNNTSSSKHVLNGTVNAYSFYVILGKSGNNAECANLPFSADEISILDFAASNFQVALASSATVIDLSNYANSNYVDILGVGSATYFEGTAASSIDKTSFIKRKDIVDTNDNGNDFAKESFNNDTFNFLKDGYVAYFNAVQHINNQGKDFTKIEDVMQFTVLLEAAGKTITWNAYEGEEETNLVTINGNQVTATPIELESHSIVLVGTVEGTDFEIEVKLNLSNLEQLADANLTLNSKTLQLCWDPVPNATSYEIYVDGELAKTTTETYENYFFYLTSIVKNSTITVKAIGPEGYIPSEAEYEYDFDSIIANRVNNTLEEAKAVFKEAYTLTGTSVVEALEKGKTFNTITLSYSSESEFVSIDGINITFTKPEIESKVTILITASFGEVVLENNTTSIEITLTPAAANTLLTKVTNVDQLKDGTQIILTYNDEVIMGEFIDSYFKGIEYKVNEESYISSDLGITVITLKKVNSSNVWLLEVGEGDNKQNIYWNSSAKVNLSTDTDAKAQWTISVNEGITNIYNCADNTRYFQYNSGTDPIRFTTYLSSSNQKAISAYIIEDIYHGKNNQSLNEIVINEEYRIDSNLSIELPMNGNKYNNVSFDYEVENGTIENGILTIQKPEIEVTVILTVTATIMNGSQAVQDDREIVFVVKNKDYRLDISDKVQITSIPDQAWTGNEITPNVVITYNEQTLIKDTHYTVEYSNNVNAGTATITVTFIGEDYTGQVETTFIIKSGKINIEDSVIIEAIEDQVYTGSQIKPNVVVKYNGETLVEETDYILSYGTNVEVGKGSVIITFIEKYEGVKTVEFNIIVSKINYSYVFGSKTDFVKNDIPIENNTFAGLNWSMTYEWQDSNTKYFNTNNTKGVQIGKGGAVIKKFTLETNVEEYFDIIKINASVGSGGNANLKVMVGDTIISTQSLSYSSTGTEYVFELANLISNEQVKIIIENTGTTAIYFRSIIIQ